MNPLLIPLQKIPTEAEWTDALLHQPPIDLNCNPLQWRSKITQLHKLFVPETQSIQIAGAIDRMMRAALDAPPNAPERNAEIYRDDAALDDDVDDLSLPPPMAIFVYGLSGSGKTKVIRRVLKRYLRKLLHQSLPGRVGKVMQVVYIYVEMPESGSLNDLAVLLAEALSLTVNDPSILSRVLAHKTAAQRFSAFVRIAKSYFLAGIVIDEIQNIFRLDALKNRVRGASKLRVADDQMFKTLLRMINSSGFVVILAGTPDALPLLDRRASIAQRLSSGGVFEIKPYSAGDDPRFDDLMPDLLSYQHSSTTHIEDSPELRDLIYKLTAGIRRSICFLWEEATSVALEKESRLLELGDFVKAAELRLSGLARLNRGLLDGDPKALATFEDVGSY